MSSLYFVKEFRARGAWNDKFIYAIDLPFPSTSDAYS
jgi:hypothetical protein